MDVKLVLFVVMVVVAVCTAQKKCCFPDQFVITNGEVIGIVQNGRGVGLTEVISLAFDYPNKKTGGFISTDQAGAVSAYQIIIDYKEGAEYVISSNRTVCQKIQLPTKTMDHCIPDSATFIGSTYFGDKKQDVDAFAFYVKDADQEGNATLTVTKGDCVPFSGSFIGQTSPSTPIVVGYGYVNYVEGIANPSHYFTVPSFCPKDFSAEPTMRSFRTKLSFL